MLFEKVEKVDAPAISDATKGAAFGIATGLGVLGIMVSLGC